MTGFGTMRCVAAMVFGALVAGAPPAEAADSPVGTYLKKAEAREAGDVDDDSSSGRRARRS